MENSTSTLDAPFRPLLIASGRVRRPPETCRSRSRFLSSDALSALLIIPRNPQSRLFRWGGEKRRPKRPLRSASDGEVGHAELTLWNGRASCVLKERPRRGVAAALAR